MSRQVAKISYIVLTRNSARTLRDALDSIRMQKHPKEIIVIDSDSTDDTKLISKKAGAKVIDVPKGNLAIARNAGLDASKGRYIAFIDSDVVLFPGWDEHMLELLDNPSIAGAGCNWFSIGDSITEKAQDIIASRHSGIIYSTSIATMNAMYDREKIGGTRFDELFSGASEDVDFNFQLRAKGYKLLFDAESFILHHNPTTISSLMRKYINYGYWFNPVYKKHPIEKNKAFWLRNAFLASFPVNMLIALLFSPWQSIFILQSIAPFLAYFSISAVPSCAIINGLKFYAHLWGMAKQTMYGGDDDVA
jgi:glycosyltransferase involved in cell wall biosynthesis